MLEFFSRKGFRYAGFAGFIGLVGLLGYGALTATINGTYTHELNNMDIPIQAFPVQIALFHPDSKHSSGLLTVLDPKPSNPHQAKKPIYPETPFPDLPSLMNQTIKAQWVKVKMDRHIEVNVLDSPFTLAETPDHLGEDYYRYAAYVYKQLAQEVPDSAMAETLNRLSLQCHELGNQVRSLGRNRFDGTPTANMNHLSTYNELITSFSPLSQSTPHRTDFTREGQQRSSAFPLPQAASPLPGNKLQDFLNQVQKLETLPASKRYPQTVQLARYQSDLIQSLSLHLAIRWENYLDDPLAKGSSESSFHYGSPGYVYRMRVYATQTMAPVSTPMVTRETVKTVLRRTPPSREKPSSKMSTLLVQVE